MRRIEAIGEFARYPFDRGSLIEPDCVARLSQIHGSVVRAMQRCIPKEYIPQLLR